MFRNGTKRWKYAQAGTDKTEKMEELSVVIHATTFDLDRQKFAVEIANQALDRFKTENEVASFIKFKFDEVESKLHDRI